MTNWIPVTERLPEMGVSVLIYINTSNADDDYYEVACRFTHNPVDGWSCNGDRIYEGVTHWRELPPPPGQEQNFIINVRPPEPEVIIIPVEVRRR